jgi:hypothetical protein
MAAGGLPKNCTLGGIPCILPPKPYIKFPSILPGGCVEELSKNHFA